MNKYFLGGVSKNVNLFIYDNWKQGDYKRCG